MMQGQGPFPVLRGLGDLGGQTILAPFLMTDADW
ncbi:hypothetical protein MITS9504_00228 [Synechococcus sp. MIT S9504]|nr:hypothetical protein MITS9504_00228 [Synechococcus sp. MIT S9504]